jgi:hypothetical protein
MRAIGVLDDTASGISGEMICDLRGMDGLFIYYAVQSPAQYVGCAARRYLVVDIIQR